ncbi:MULTISPECIES: response regulator [unclassified Novosphingobium]|uniref:response regulator n=1 Tax=Novosphingobium TaxID=165696 RepID=UPI001445FCD1|nr:MULTISPECIES: response regulator [unclassified Novosphingobium]NKJ42124.1 DNA-binding NarL/FixJ family response regulator [Novosphingobium sp. SG720]NMN04513.1 DNA-binding NarL/FixJ family response regulator [Novosphingobium sp. SG919]NMN85495.1 DNA-binding NarL/FixJ family response regulator [Novosphingobium sp. SG916]
MEHQQVRRDTVLVVDDEPAALHLLTDTLEAGGIQVLVATAGQTALDLLQHITPDLVLMDAIMPGIDGFETTARIKANPQTAHVPVIFMTGLTESEHVIEGFEVGGVDYVRKPINVHELLARVRVHLGHARAVQASTASLDATGRLMMATDTSGFLLWCTPLAEQAINRIAPGWRRDQPELPDELRQSVGRLLAKTETGSSLRIEQGEGALELVLIAHYRENEVLIRLNELNPQVDARQLQTRLGLTEREAEVLLWISYGKSNADISQVLVISPRTVQKHLERIYEKLGVETRAAAAAIAIKALTP